MFKASRILVPTDMLEHSTRALRKAFDIARHFNSEVFLLHVIQDPVRQHAIDYCIDDELFKQMQTLMFESVRTEMRRQLALFPSVDPKNVTFDIRTGAPYDEILKLAEERNIDLIVIGFLGSSDLAKYLIGGVARQVLLSSNCSVLIVK